MNLALIGYGKMGKAIESMAVEKGHAVSGVADNPDQLMTIPWEKTDAAIEFSTPETAFENIKCCIDYQTPVISGTTGWLETKPDLDQYCIEHGGTFFYASNFSIGVNIFFKLNQQLASMMSSYDFKASIEEIHHTEKKDAPSGTALSLAKDLMKKIQRYQSWQNHPSTDPNVLGITSLREDKVPGTHTVNYDSELESIQIKHTAHDRKVFVQGVIAIAEWIQGRSGVLTMDDFLKI